MIAPNENGRALQGSAPTVASERASAPNAAQKDSVPAVTWEVVMLHSLDDFDRHVLPMGATPYDPEYIRGLEADRPLVCPCNNGAGPCPECRAKIDAMLARIRSAQGLDEGESGYFVDSRDGEARDEPEDVS